MLTLENKVVVVTGAGSGIGRVTAMILANAGAKLVVSGHHRPTVEQVAAEIRERGGTAIAIAADVLEETSVIKMIEGAVSHFGRLDGAFNNAGVEMHNKLTAELTLDEWDRVFAVDVWGVFLCMKQEIAAMRKTGGGAVVNNSSMNGLVAIPHATEYTAAKHAVTAQHVVRPAKRGKPACASTQFCPG